ncbi:hypothetical protein O4H53_22155 [Sulfitobacter sp. G21635-S1]|uniref:hypothetical protein n=1 Tax=Sulfitobacter sp. G21635-S1 TaxID=3014043 RepID=UPI0022B0656D|nr:hypothetical protein [Sulfitobacter sp. G21635-S1]MCZ4258258.1 hypothetical protein [Sulfitobacter sp. G21635-S1]
MDTNDLITLVTTYIAHAGGSEATISNKVTTNARLFSRLRSGKGCNVSTFSSALIWFDENWPDDLQWPRDIPRPPKKKDAA